MDRQVQLSHARPMQINTLIPRRKISSAQLILVLSLLGIGTAYRTHQLLDYSLWLDESWVAIGTQTKTLEEFLLALSHSPVLFALLIRLAFEVFRHPELGARFLPFAFSVIALALAFRLGKALQGTLGGLIALALVAVHSDFIDQAKKLKQYSLDAALALAISWLNLRS